MCIRVIYMFSGVIGDSIVFQALQQGSHLRMCAKEYTKSRTSVCLACDGSILFFFFFKNPHPYPGAPLLLSRLDCLRISFAIMYNQFRRFFYDATGAAIIPSQTQYATPRKILRKTQHDAWCCSPKSIDCLVIVAPPQIDFRPRPRATSAPQHRNWIHILKFIHQEILILRLKASSYIRLLESLFHGCQ